MSDDAADLEKLAAEVLGNWSLPSSSRPASYPTVPNLAPAGSQSSGYNSKPGPPPAAEEWIQIPFDGWDSTSYGELKPAAKPSGGSTQRVIPDRCSYARGQKIDGAPMVPMAPLTEERHPDLYEKACAKIRRYVCTHFRAWPACPCSNRNVALTFSYGYDTELGDVLIGFLKCEECK